MQKLTTKRRSQESRSPVDRDAANRCESLNPNTSSGSGAVKSWLRNTQLVAHTTQSVENKTSAVTVVDRSESTTSTHGCVIERARCGRNAKETENRDGGGERREARRRERKNRDKQGRQTWFQMGTDKATRESRNGKHVFTVAKETKRESTPSDSRAKIRDRSYTSRHSLALSVPFALPVASELDLPRPSDPASAVPVAPRLAAQHGAAAASK